MNMDLIGTRAEIDAGRLSATTAFTASLAAARLERNRHSYVSLDPRVGTSAARAVDDSHAAGAPLLPLAGLAVSIKDLFDVHGEVTSAGSTVLATSPAATHDCPAVARLRRAGAALLGRTNMSEFAFSGVGINPHYGTPPNPAASPEGGPDPVERVPGGSTSGGAVTVATGAAWAALGSDTGGSIRIPAALQGLVGFKNTARLTPTEGTIPLSSTLDTVCAVTHSVRDAVLLHEVLADRRAVVARRPIAALRFAVPTTLMLDALERPVARAFQRALAALRAAGAQIDEIALAPLAEVADINAHGGFSPVEAWAWHRGLLADHEAAYDPRVALRIRRGAAMSAADYIDLLRRRAGWIAAMQAQMAGYDAMLSPTVPCVAPALAPLRADDAAFFAANSLLLRNPSVVNLLDGCAISLPCHASGSLPVGLMLWSSALGDDTVLGAALAVEATLVAESR
jgi:aspartyl-tRNA(Asn)/glutamyl-tRNA(Gln) amidotransferase subunit A